MANKQRDRIEVVPPAEEPEEMPLPSDPKVIFLGGLFALALLAALYVAAEIVLPLVLAVVLNLLLQPALRLLERWHLPRMLAALLLILAVFGTIVGLGAAVNGENRGGVWPSPRLFACGWKPRSAAATITAGCGSLGRVPG